jgi:hypothetical protein
MFFQHHTALIIPEAAVYGRAEFIIINYLQFAVWTCGVYFFINAGISDCLASVRYRNEQKRRVGTSPVPG